MTVDADADISKSLQEEIQTLHPDIGSELEGAINTLRKLQQIAGNPTRAPLANPRPRPARADDDLAATLDAGFEPGEIPHANGNGVDATLVGSVAETETQDTFVRPDSTTDGQSKKTPLLAVRETFGRYLIVQKLGQGAMGAVYLAYDSQLERHVALKTPFLGDNPEILERFYREARAAAKLRSPFICPVYDVDNIGDVHYISMAYIDGESLGSAMRSGSLADEKDIVLTVQRIAQGIQRAHEAGIIHRDIKPENIMLDTHGDPIVMDFGLARWNDDESQLTTPGRLLGTPAFMSPEQVEGDREKIGPRSDVYSLGVVLYEMLTGKLPFKGSIISVIRQIATVDPPKPSELAPDGIQNPQLEAVCLKMMAKSMDDRYASMGEAADALEQCLHKEPPTRPPSAWRQLLAKCGLSRKPQQR